MVDISTQLKMVPVPNESALEASRQERERELSQDVSFGIGNLLAVEQSSLEDSPRGGGDIGIYTAVCGPVETGRYLPTYTHIPHHASNGLSPFIRTSHRSDHGGVLIDSHGRSRMTVDPRTPTMPGQSTSGFHRPGRHCLRQGRSAVSCWASRMKGELHPTKNRL